MQNTGLDSALNHTQESLKGVPPLDLIIDWIQVTFKGLNIRDCLSLFDLNLDDTYYVSKGLFGYHNTYVVGEKIKFMTSNNPNMGIHLMLSGRACREWELKVNGSWKRLFQVIFYTDSKVTRIDFAIDSFTKKYFTTQKVINAIRNKTVSTRALYAINTEKIYLNSYTIQGHSVRFGNSSSEVSLIFYDKLQERKQASYLVDNSITIWERCELRLRGDTANNCIKYIQSNQDSLIENELLIDLDMVKSILTNYINFKQLKGTKQIRHREHIKWWSDFIDHVKPLQLSSKALQSTIQRKKEWVELSVSKTLAMLYLSDIEDFNSKELQKHISNGMSKFKSQDLELINQYRIEKGASIITEDEYKKMTRKLKTSIELII